MRGEQPPTSAAARNLFSEVTALNEHTTRFKADEGSGAHRNGKPSRAGVKAGAATSAKFDVSDLKVDVSTTKRLPADAVSALTRPEDDWREF